jgi:hypothetical protein
LELAGHPRAMERLARRLIRRRASVDHCLPEVVGIRQFQDRNKDKTSQEKLIISDTCPSLPFWNKKGTKRRLT